MSDNVLMAFHPAGKWIELDRILPSKQLPKTIQGSSRYHRIVASIAEVGIVEPPIVFPEAPRSRRFMMLDGHLRLAAVKELGHEKLFCLVAKDDEGFTYNHKVSQLSPIQEHFMVAKAIADGVSEERIAKALNVRVGTVEKKRDLLEGICPEAVELLKERQATAGALGEIKRVKPIRQIEMAELMVAADNMTRAYAKCLVAATPPDLLIENERSDPNHGLNPKDLARMRREMEGLEREFKSVQSDYGQNMLNLVVVAAYLRRLLDNTAVVKFLSRHEPDLLEEFQRIIDSADLRATG